MKLSKSQLLLLDSEILTLQSDQDIQKTTEKFQVPVTYLKARAKKLGIHLIFSERGKALQRTWEKRNNENLEYQKLLAAVKERYAEEGPEKVALEYNATESNVMALASRLGIKSIYHKKRSGRTQSLNNKNCDTSVFDDPLTPEAAYFLGLFWADGTIQLAKNRETFRIKLSLSEQDWHLLYEFRSFLKFDGQLMVPYKPDSVRQRMSGVQLHNKILGQKLVERGMVPKKSLIDPPPLDGIPDYLYHHFARGLLDGDGTLNYGGKLCLWTPRIFWHSSYMAMYDIRDRIVKLTGVPYKAVVPVKGKRSKSIGCWRSGWAKWEEVSHLLEWMHQDGGTYSYRKHDRPLLQLSIDRTGLYLRNDSDYYVRPRSIIESMSA